MTAAEARLQGLLAANTAFYGAFEQLNLPAMREVWADEDGIVCIHPGWQVCRGVEEVEDSWRRIFENTPYIEFGVTVIDSGVSGDRGWIVCEEAILQGNPNGLTRSVVLSTNMFREQGGKWRMTLHHGSPVVQRPVMEED